MTKAWGPLGWATLHSIAAMYSDSPTELEKVFITRWIESFQRTITCEMCRTHFAALLKEYQSTYPDWNASRTNLVHFALRAHNTVNANIGKPVYSAEDCLRLLKENIPPEKAATIRQSYIVYVRKEWSRDMTMTGISAVKYIKDLITVEQDYWSRKGFSWDDIRITESIGPLSSAKKTPHIRTPVNIPPFSLKLPTARFSFLSR